MFQCPATDYAQSLIILHNYLMMFLIGIGVFVTALLVYIIQSSSHNKALNFDHNVRDIYFYLDFLPQFIMNLLKTSKEYNKFIEGALIKAIYNTKHTQGVNSNFFSVLSQITYLPSISDGLNSNNDDDSASLNSNEVIVENVN